jgi:glucose-1-phosphate thymidylyltransferase
MRGIILAGGSGTRIYPITEGISKQLMPIYDKPMIFYPLTTLMLADIRDILIITTPNDQASFQHLLGDGSKFGLNLEYTVQSEPRGLADAFIVGEEFIGDSPCAMILGDNIFYGNGFTRLLQQAKQDAEAGFATNFGFRVHDPERFGIMELDADGHILSVEEKPTSPKSDFAVTGLYFYPAGVSKYAKQVIPSARGEVEISTLNDMYLQEGRLNGQLLGNGFCWFDTGTFDSQMDAAVMIRALETNQSRIIACPEQIAFDKGWITAEQLMERAELLKKNSYGAFLHKVLEVRS